MGDFTAYLLRAEHVFIMVAVWSTIATFQRVFPLFAENRIWVRVLPLIPTLLCSAVVWIPGLSDGSPAEKALLGVVLGAFCGNVYKIARQSVFGHDDRLQRRRSRL